MKLLAHCYILYYTYIEQSEHEFIRNTSKRICIVEKLTTPSVGVQFFMRVVCAHIYIKHVHNLQ